MWNRDHKHGLKLYVQRVFIMDDAEQFMPNYLRFVRGLIDSSDLPLNVSREILGDSTVTRNLRNALTKRVLQMLENWRKTTRKNTRPSGNSLASVLKEGPAEDFANQKRSPNCCVLLLLIPILLRRPCLWKTTFPA